MRRWGSIALAALVVWLLVDRPQHGEGHARGGDSARAWETGDPSQRDAARGTPTGTVPAGGSVVDQSLDARTLASTPVPADAERASSTPPPPSEETVHLTLKPGDNGNYYVNGSINGHAVVFLVDTGASWISIPERLRWALSLDRGQYLLVATAAGVVGNYATRVENLEVGPFHFTDVAAALNPYAPNDVVLLGMSALKSVQFTQNRGQLVLSQQRPVVAPVAPVPLIPPVQPLVIRRSVRDCVEPGGVIDSNTLKCMEGR